MDKRVITHVFGALQSLEKCMSNVKDMLPNHGKAVGDVSALIPQHEKVLVKMRRTANCLQLELAREDWNASIRSLRIFYGLNHLIRKDILSLNRKLTGARSGLIAAPATSEQKAIVYH